VWTAVVERNWLEGLGVVVVGFSQVEVLVLIWAVEREERCFLQQLGQDYEELDCRSVET